MNELLTRLADTPLAQQFAPHVTSLVLLGISGGGNLAQMFLAKRSDRSAAQMKMESDRKIAEVKAESDRTAIELSAKHDREMAAEKAKHDREVATQKEKHDREMAALEHELADARAINLQRREKLDANLDRLIELSGAAMREKFDYVKCDPNHRTDLQSAIRKASDKVKGHFYDTLVHQMPHGENRDALIAAVKAFGWEVRDYYSSEHQLERAHRTLLAAVRRMQE